MLHVNGGHRFFGACLLGTCGHNGHLSLLCCGAGHEVVVIMVTYLCCVVVLVIRLGSVLGAGHGRDIRRLLVMLMTFEMVMVMTFVSGTASGHKFSVVFGVWLVMVLMMR